MILRWLGWHEGQRNDLPLFSTFYWRYIYSQRNQLKVNILSIDINGYFFSFIVITHIGVCLLNIVVPLLLSY